MTSTVAAGLTAAVRSLVVARDRDECVLGRPDLGIYVAVPEPGAVFVETLQQGGTLAEATAAASRAAGAEVDGQDFLDGLTAAGLLEAPAGQDAATGPAGRRIRWIEGVSPAAARRLFGTVGWTCYGLAAAFAVAVMALRPDLRTKDRLWALSEAEAAELASIDDHDRRVARWFGVAYLVGMLLLGWATLAWGVPVVIGVLLWVKGNLTAPDLTSVAFWESVAVALAVVGQWAALPLLALRERRLRRSGALR